MKPERKIFTVQMLLPVVIYLKYPSSTKTHISLPCQEQNRLKPQKSMHIKVHNAVLNGAYLNYFVSTSQHTYKPFILT